MELTKAQAKAIYDSGDWKNWTHEERARFQLHTERLCMDFGAFHESVERVLGRGVFIHEFADPERLLAEFNGDREPPTMEEIMAPLAGKIVFEV